MAYFTCIKKKSLILVKEKPMGVICCLNMIAYIQNHTSQVFIPDIWKNNSATKVVIKQQNNVEEGKNNPHLFYAF